MTMKTIDVPKKSVDQVITEVRRHKEEIGEAFGFDVVALGRSLQQRETGDPRFKTPGGKPVNESQATARSGSDLPP